MSHLFIRTRSIPHPPTIALRSLFASFSSSSSSSLPLLHFRWRPQFPAIAARSKPGKRPKILQKPHHVADADAEEITDEDDLEEEEEEEEGGRGSHAFPFADGYREEEEEEEKEEEGEEDGTRFSNWSSGYGGRDGGKDYDRDPELADIIGSCFDDPKKAQSRIEERVRRKRDKIVHAKTGSATPMKVIFNKFEYANSYIWFEFYRAPLPKDVNFICDVIRSWHIIGRLGGCNSMNMQLSQSPLETKRPIYDVLRGANVEPSTFYNISDLEIQDNLARIWVDIGNDEPLLLDVLVNALICVSSDYVGIKQVVFGGKEFGDWNENLKSEDAGYGIHTI